MNKIIKQDLYRYEGNRCESLRIQLRYFFFVPGFTYIYFFRRVQLSKNVLIKAFFYFFLKVTSYITHIQIPPSTNIKEGFRIVHFGTIVVNPEVKIGRNFNISEGTLIGNAQGKLAGVPTIGDNVCMNANSIIIGKCKIGNNVLIAPGAFVNFDVPDNSIVIGNPGRIIQRDSSPSDKYIVYPLP
ncbi:MAG: serine acetyltransferase [Phocaeicola sp.]|uniref:serine acetyltransferase n=1 Tax=Phocaeicola TaxID=909656 RepID=UPI00234EAE43|nr:serine acetyltransferase [Phocaeicola oris]MCE2617192.1 serine acetyltransferase [Phocaeicola oris]